MLGIEKLIDHRDDACHAVHQRNVGCVGQNCQSRFRVLAHIAVQISAFEAVHFSDVVEPHAVGIAVYEEHRRFGGSELFGAEVVWFHGRRFEVVEKIGE